MALRKTIWLLEAGAEVEIISPQISPGLVKYTREYPNAVHWREEPYVSQSLKKYFLVMAAASEAAVNNLVAEDATRDGILVNVASNRKLCSFFVPATVRRGQLQISMSSMGASPSLLARMREEIEENYPFTYKHYIEALGRVRDWVHLTLPNDETRRRKVLRRLAERKIAEHLAGLDEDEMFARMKIMVEEILDMEEL